MSWSHRALQIKQDDINKNPLYNQYPYQEVDDYEDEEEDMEVDDQVLGNAECTCMAAPTGTRCPYCRPEASYATFTEQPSASPQSIHTDTDAAMEFDTLNAGTTRQDTQKVAPQEVPP